MTGYANIAIQNCGSVLEITFNNFMWHNWLTRHCASYSFIVMCPSWPSWEMQLNHYQSKWARRNTHVITLVSEWMVTEWRLLVSLIKTVMGWAIKLSMWKSMWSRAGDLFISSFANLYSIVELLFPHKYLGILLPLLSAGVAFCFVDCVIRKV